MEIKREDLMKVLRLIFPEFSNKLTCIVVYSGIGLLSKSLVIILLELLLETKIEFKISEYDNWIGFALVALGLLYNIVTQLINRNWKSSEQDSVKELYQYILNVEGAFNSGIRSPEKWNEYQDILSSLKNRYHELRAEIPAKADRDIERIITIGYDIMSGSIDSPVPQNLAAEFRKLKEKILSSTRS